jgi:L-asparaginase / beta-aspartyl-peptidase
VAPVIAVHGGAGSGAAATDAHEEALRDAVDRARGMLDRAGSALDAAIAAVVFLEDCPLFNAGRGAVPTAEGGYEFDAAVMDGLSRSFGAVAAVSSVRNPVLLALAVMERTPHALLAGRGAERFAASEGLEAAGPDWFGQHSDTHEPGDAGGVGGTVGAVVRDEHGHLAAATSTGGMRGQIAGRVGDTPIPGAGTYADDVVAVSATGNGEAMMRAVAGHEISALVRHAGVDLGEAADRVIAELDGGLIAVGRDGALAMPFTTPALYRGWARGSEAARAAIR